MATSRRSYKRETIIGLISLIILLTFIWLAYFLKGKNIFSNEHYYHAIYPTSGGITVSSPVSINGMKVGRVTHIQFVSQEDKRIKITMGILNKHKIPENSVAELVSSGLLGGREIHIILGDSPKMALPEHVFAGYNVPDLTDGIDLVKEKLTSSLVSLDSILIGFKQLTSETQIQSLSESFAQLQTTLTHLSGISRDVQEIIENERQNISEIIDNTRQFSNTLSDVDVQQTMHTVDSCVNALNAALQQLHNPEGNLGKLLYNDSLYMNVENSANQLQLLLEDIRLHPKRYINVTVFGRKEKEKK